MKKSNAALTVITAACALSSAQAAEQDVQVWNAVVLEHALTAKIPATLEFGGRLVDDAGRLGVVLVRPTIGYRVSDNLTVSLGYAYFRTVNRGRPDASENRVFQQVNWRIGSIGRATLLSRFRLEQRRFAGAHDLGWRMTARIRMRIPIEGKRASIMLSHEQIYALNTTDWGARAGFDQMRNFVGVNLPLSEAVMLETGYQNRYQIRQGVADRIDHIIPVTLNIKI